MTHFVYFNTTTKAEISFKELNSHTPESEHAPLIHYKQCDYNTQLHTCVMSSLTGPLHQEHSALVHCQTNNGEGVMLRSITNVNNCSIENW